MPRYFSSIADSFLKRWESNYTKVRPLDLLCEVCNVDFSRGGVWGIFNCFPGCHPARIGQTGLTLE